MNPNARAFRQLMWPTVRVSGPPRAFAIDSLLAATALRDDLRLVTHTTKDFDYVGLEVINLWETAAG